MSVLATLPPLWLETAAVERWEGRPVPAARFAIAGLIPDRCCSLLAGDGGSGKSILLQTAATCIAAGRPFLGHAVEQGPALYISAEDPEEVLHARQDRIGRALDVTPQDVRGNLYAISMADEDFTLFSGGAQTDLELRLGQNLVAYGIRFCAIDSAALVFDDMEIDRRAVSTFMRRMNMLARRTDCAIVLITHTSRSSDNSSARMASGSTAWVNAARAGLQLKSDGEGGAKLTLLKANYSKLGAEIDLRWTDDGVLIAADQPTGMVAAIDQNNDDKLALAEIATAWSASGTVPLSRAPQMKERYLPHFMSRKHGWKPGRTTAALTRLSDAGKISTGEVRKNGKRQQGLCPISDEK